LQRALSALVTAVSANPTAGSAAWLARTTEWEVGLYFHRHEEAAGVEQKTVATAFTREALQDYVRNRFPDWIDFHIQQFHVLYGGFSKKTILFETTDAKNGDQSLVVRAEQGDTLLTFDGSDITREFPTVQILFRAGLPVPEPLWLEDDPSVLGARFFVSRKVEGSNYGNPAGSTKPISDDQIADVIKVMARIHSVRLDLKDPLLRQSHLYRWATIKSLADNTRLFARSFLEGAVSRVGIEPTPLLSRIYGWLLENVPSEEGTAVLTHLDYALNNLLLDEQGVTAVLDWETSRVGDPAEEIAWTYANLSKHITRDRFLELYKTYTGIEVSDYRLAYFDVMSAFKVIIVCMCSLRYIDKSDAADVTLCSSAYRYLYRACGHVNDLMIRAELLRK
jgi:aminoglycoside phosphotransferase (APT) family kinase protein